MASCPQPRNRLRERRSENDVMSIYMWKKEAGNKGREVKKVERNENKEMLERLVPRDFGSGRKFLGKRSQKGCQCEKPGIM